MSLDSQATTFCQQKSLRAMSGETFSKFMLNPVSLCLVCLRYSLSYSSADSANTCRTGLWHCLKHFFCVVSGKSSQCQPAIQWQSHSPCRAIIIPSDHKVSLAPFHRTWVQYCNRNGWFSAWIQAWSWKRAGSHISEHPQHQEAPAVTTTFSGRVFLLICQNPPGNRVNLNKAGGTCHFPCTASAGLRLIR